MAATPAAIAAAPDAQAFSQRTAGLNRRSGEAWWMSDDAKPSLTMPELKCPRKTASTSLAGTPASSMASRAALTMRSSSLSASSRPNLVWPLPTSETVCLFMMLLRMTVLLAYDGHSPYVRLYVHTRTNRRRSTHMNQTQQEALAVP